MIVDLETLPDELAKVKNLPRLTAELMQLVNKIPFYCGHPECFAPGCLAIRDAREKMREIFNHR